MIGDLTKGVAPSHCFRHGQKGNARSSKKASPEATAIAKLLSKHKVKGVAFDIRKNVVVLRVLLAANSTAARALSGFKAPAPK